MNEECMNTIKQAIDLLSSITLDTSKPTEAEQIVDNLFNSLLSTCSTTICTLNNHVLTLLPKDTTHNWELTIKPKTNTSIEITGNNIEDVTTLVEQLETVNGIAVDYAEGTASDKPFSLYIDTEDLVDKQADFKGAIESFMTWIDVFKDRLSSSAEYWENFKACVKHEVAQSKDLFLVINSKFNFIAIHNTSTSKQIQIAKCREHLHIKTDDYVLRKLIIAAINQAKEVAMFTAEAGKTIQLRDILIHGDCLESVVHILISVLTKYTISTCDGAETWSVNNVLITGARCDNTYKVAVMNIWNRIAIRYISGTLTPVIEYYSFDCYPNDVELWFKVGDTKNTQQEIMTLLLNMASKSTDSEYIKQCMNYDKFIADLLQKLDYYPEIDYDYDEVTGIVYIGPDNGNRLKIMQTGNHISFIPMGDAHKDMLSKIKCLTKVGNAYRTKSLADFDIYNTFNTLFAVLPKLIYDEFYNA